MTGVQTCALPISLKNKSVVAAAAVIEKEEIGNLKKSFIHGSKVMFINSVIYKGMVGFVTDFFPAKYQVTIKETDSQRNNRIEKSKLNQISRLYPDITNDEKQNYLKTMKQPNDTINPENVKIGDKIMTPYGMVVVDNIIPKMYSIITVNGELVNVKDITKKYIIYVSSNKYEMELYTQRVNELKKRKQLDRKSTRLNSSHERLSRMPSSA